VLVNFWGIRKKYEFAFRLIKQDLLSYTGERITMSEETVEIDEEVLEEDEEYEEDEGSRDWGKVGLVMLFFLLIVIGYYVITALS
jgi:cytochrome c-type biogenesis protein CcmH/NrfG